MKNLVCFSDSSISIYNKALSSKRDDLLKERLSTIEAEIITAFTQYDAIFGNNQLETLTANPIFTPHKDDLSGLYKYSSETIRALKETIDGIQPFYLSNTCQNCTINSVNSMDHVLGQAGFPEYCVHPLNLFPSCTECNGYKSTSFTKNGRRRFLNLYCDVLPNVQYLFVNIFTNDKGDLDYSFTVDNRNGIEDNIYNLIKSHYADLYLLKRMKTHSVKFYTELRNTVKSRMDDVSWEVVVRQVKKESSANMNNLGFNHFQYVLNNAMIEHNLFKQSFSLDI